MYTNENEAILFGVCILFYISDFKAQTHKHKIIEYNIYGIHRAYDILKFIKKKN
jgi:hypothetical protein